MSMIIKLFSIPYFILPKNKAVLFILWLSWVTLLYVMSSLSSNGGSLPPIWNIDKVMHFTYFFAGAVTVAKFLQQYDSLKLTSKSLVRICILLGAIVGALDEFHQSFVPGRYGNDPIDFAADVLGSFAGASYAVYIFKKKSN